MPLNERKTKILLSIIKEYIETAEPVGSLAVIKKFGFPYSSATVRAEMLELEKEGYLYQPHTSAGRVPTDKAYKFFTEYFFEKKLKIEKEIKFAKQVEKQIKKFIEQKEATLKWATRILSAMSGNLAVGWASDQKEFFSSGLSHLLKQPELSDVGHLLSFGEIFDKMESEIDAMFDGLGSGKAEVFIGSDMPIENADNFSLIASKWNSSSGDKGIIAVFGPKRMNYEQNIGLVEYLSEKFEEI